MKTLILRALEGAALVIAMLMYPIMSVTWYRSCKSYGDQDSRKFLLYGILGSIGILGMAMTLFVPWPWKDLVVAFTGIPYIVGLTKQLKLILKKRRNPDLLAD